MAIPTEALAEHFSSVLSADWSVIRGPISNVTPPMLVLRADEPWIAPHAYCHDQQRYAAVGLVSAATPEDGEADLYDLIAQCQDQLPEGWAFVNASRPIVDRTTGVAYLAAIIRLSYLNNPGDEAS